jgi:hypothetical protein
MSPEVAAQGGSFTAVARGYNALFTNPAGFTGAEGSFTLIALNPWLHANPYRFFETTKEDGSFQAMADEIVAGSFGIGFAAGAGYTGRGLGLGVVLVGDSRLYGRNLLGTTGEFHITLGLIGGYGFSARFLGMSLDVGLSLKPLMRVQVPLPNEIAVDLLENLLSFPDLLALLSGVDSRYGVGMAMDLGLILTAGPFRLGAVVRNFGGTDFAYNRAPLGTLMATLSGASSNPEGQPVETSYRIPMKIHAGAAVVPTLGGFEKYLAPSIHAEIEDIAVLWEDGTDPRTILQIGAELELFSALSLRAGLNRGYATFGCGLSLGILDINAAVYTEEGGRRLGDRPISSLSIELAVRF